MSSAASDSGLVLPPRPAALGTAAHKGDAGRVVCLAGSREMPGAALLASRAALRAGAGLVTLGCLDAELLALAPAATPELLLWDLSSKSAFGQLDVVGLERGLGARSPDVVVCGPGLGVTERTGLLLRNLLPAWGGTLVLDADALNLVAESAALRRALRDREDAGALTVLTPHPGEAARLLGDGGGADLGADEEARLAAARTLAGDLGSLVCLKGAGTVVHDGSRAWVNPSGNPGMATAGSGDVLAGCLASLLVGATRDSVFEAVCAAVYLHGLAGDRAARRLGQRAVIASDLIDELGPAEVEGPWRA
ncbi:MAG: NAD(P)H-hydrate dehydratase [Planctomycetota bacterium]|nr:NAD(P)H-hydrate dehydratase [Planctomycetota bacterium]